MSAGVINNPTSTDLSQIAGEYDLFFARMSYLLGDSKTWIACGDVATHPDLARGQVAALCQNADDNAPE